MTVRIVVGGVSGAGKSSVGAALARALAVPFTDGDDLHPATNVAKMASGAPLTDADRAPWLRRVGENLHERGGVVACSALRASYRTVIREAAPDARIYLLVAPEETLAGRLAARPGHFMPPTLLRSQLDVFEPPSGPEDATVVDATSDVEEVVARIVRLWSSGTVRTG